MDTDNDGELSAEEIKKAPETLKTLDRNKDGRLSEIEFRPPPPPMGRQGGGGQGAGGNNGGAAAFVDSVLRYDKDKDGKVSAKELPERMRRLLDQGDTNSDGLLDRAEIGRLARNQRPAPPRGPNPPPPPDDR